MSRSDSDKPGQGRATQLRIRLSPAVEGQAAQVKLYPNELAAIKKAAVEMGYSVLRGTSSFVRDCGIAAAKDYEPDPEGPEEPVIAMLERAAEAAGMNVSQWLRAIVLETVGLSTAARQVLESQMALAKQAYETNSLRLSGDDLEEG